MARSLTKCIKNGELYTRPADIEEKIDLALTQDLATIRLRSTVTDRASPDYLPSECLVHLIREAHRHNNDPTMNALLPVLLARCGANLLATVVLDSEFAHATDIREEVLGQFAVLFAIDGSVENPDELDFFECRFNRAFRGFRIDLVRRETTHAKHFAPWPETPYEEGSEAHDKVFTRLSEEFHMPARQESDLLQHDLLEAINSLPPDERRAVILCHVLGYQEESEDPDKQTAATRCGVKGRTIRNRLSRAAAKLSRFKENA